MKNNPGWQRLSQLPKTRMRSTDLTPESRQKVIDTVRYSLSQDPFQQKEVVVERCVIAQLAEQLVAQWMEGWCNHGSEDTSDPLSYAYDVLSNIKYCGMRIEVKTHQSASNYISVNTGHVGPFKGTKGLHVRPFLDLGIADVMIVIETKPDITSGGWIMIPKVMLDPNALRHPRVTHESQYGDGYFLKLGFISEKVSDLMNIFIFKNNSQGSLLYQKDVL